jgi:nicotinamide-nucleotide amidase
MKAHIITIGDEILIGQTLNTNAAYLGEQLALHQFKINGSSVVADDEEMILKEFKRAMTSSDILLVTGGLGPTHDDITCKCVTEFFETELVEDEEVLNDVKRFFEARGRVLTETNRAQALVPKIAIPIRNSKGTAPGFWIEKGKKIFVCMPGVPYEMKNMMEYFVLPKLSEKFSKNYFISVKNLLSMGIPESTLFDRLGNIDDLLQGSKLAFLPSQFGVKMRITVEEKTEEEAKNKLIEIEQKIRSMVGQYIYGSNEDTLEGVVAKLLVDRGLKIAVAESCTGGLINNRLTNISGSSQYLDLGIVSYSNAIKVDVLKVKESTLQEVGAVSADVALQMAEGIRAFAKSDIGLAVTGIMGPTGAVTNKPIGLVYVALCDDKGKYVKEFRFGDDRLLNKDRTSQAALEMVRRNLLGIADAD